MKLVWISRELMVALCMVLGVNDVLLEYIEAHLEDVMGFVVVTETFFFVLCINVAQLLASLRMFNAHFSLEVLKYYKSILHIS